MSNKAPLCRLNLDIAPSTKEEIRLESARTGLSMTQVMMRAWTIYKLVQSGDIRRHSEGEWVKLEVL